MPPTGVWWCQIGQWYVWKFGSDMSGRLPVPFLIVPFTVVWLHAFRALGAINSESVIRTSGQL